MVIPSFFPYLFHNLDLFIDLRRVESGKGLVEQNYFRLCGKGAGNLESLSFAERESLGEDIYVVGKAGKLQHFEGLPPPPPPYVLVLMKAEAMTLSRVDILCSGLTT